jgi:hypothetical protein
VETKDTILEAYCFGSCTACSAEGISLQELDRMVDIYPNPSTGQFEIILNIPKTGEMSIQVYSVTGQLVQSRELILSTGHHTEVFNLEQKGIYLVEIRSGQDQVFRKVLIQ